MTGDKIKKISNNYSNNASYFPADTSAYNSLATLSSTFIPKLKQEPIISLAIDFTSGAYETSNFILDILTILCIETFPTKLVPAVPEPLLIPDSLNISAAVGGTLTSTENFFVSGSTSTLTGTFIPGKSLVFSLIVLTTCKILIPSGPRAGPNGGPALASPPLTKAFTIFFSLINYNLTY